MEHPIVKPEDLILIGKDYRKAVVCTVLEDNEIEIVYIDDKGKAINENVRWGGRTWEFVSGGPSGGYADNNPRLGKFVTLLRLKSGRLHL